MPKVFSSMSLQDAMELLGEQQIRQWPLTVKEREPSQTLLALVYSWNFFDLLLSEPAKVLIIDNLFQEVAPTYPNLKIWKAAHLEVGEVHGIADYLVAPNRAYLSNPFLCVVEAKLDDFVRGQIQCVAEMAACRAQNIEAGVEIDTFGIVSNGQQWDFYRVPAEGGVFQSQPFTIGDIPKLLGALHFVWDTCARNVPDDLIRSR